jgi:hypothetical protein
MSAGHPLFMTEFRARVEPTDRDSLKPSALPLIGREFTFQRQWILDEGDYEGQWACTFSKDDEESLRASGELATFDWCWFPEEDLVEV